MPSARHLPLAILGLMLFSAAAVLVIGVVVAREEKTVPIEEDRSALTGFTTRLLGEIGDLESLYENHLLEIRDQVRLSGSTIQTAAACRNIIGVEQVTIFRDEQAPVAIDLRETDRSGSLPVPRRLGDPDPSGEGLIVDLEALRDEPFGPGYRWLDVPGHPPHFVATLDVDSSVVLRIDPMAAAAAMDSWLAEWLPPAFEPVEVARITTVLENPAGNPMVSSGEIDSSIDPALLLPIPSRFGDWKISSWQKTETTVSYRQPVLIGSSALAVLLAVAGLVGFDQQRRSLRLSEQRVSFVNRVSHELRTPLTNILLNIDLVADSLPEDREEDSKRLNLIREESGRLGRLLENVLTFSRREEEKKERGEPESPGGGETPRLVSCNLNELMDDVIAQFSASLSRKNLEVRRSWPESPVFVLADPDGLSQIASNLISNVEKYASGGRFFEIEIRKEAERGKAVLAVSDSGPGIPDSAGPRIFRPFVRLDDRTTEGVSGTGIGLAIARDLAESMNGTLELEKQERPGARFEVTLSLAPENVIAIAS